MITLSPEAVEAMTADDTFVPENLRHGLKRYIENGVPTGSFLDAVLCNNLALAVFKADPETLKHLATVVRWLHNHAPARSHGNENHVRGYTESVQRELRAGQ